MATNPLLGYVQNLEVMFNQNAPNKAQCVLINHTAPAVQVKSSSGTPQRAGGAGGSGRQIAGPQRLRHLSLAGIGAAAIGPLPSAASILNSLGACQKNKNFVPIKERFHDGKF